MASIISRAVISFSKKISGFCESRILSAAFHSGGPTSHLPQNLIPKKDLLPTKNNTFLTVARSGFASLHTEGDRRFADLLRQEIDEEEQRSNQLPKLSDGWKVSLSGAEGSLSKNQAGDQIEITFNLNGSVPALGDQADETGEEEEGVIASYPDFTVKVTKSGGNEVVELECYFPEDVQEGITDDTMNSVFSIRSVVVYEGEIDDETYIIDTENLDPALYSYFMSFLADRSVDSHFAQEFIQLATAAEHQEYIRSLKKLKAFVSSK